MNDPQNPYPYQPTPAPRADLPAPMVPVNPVKVQCPNRRTGKIARLPKSVRDQINEMLLDGLKYADVIQALGADGKNLNTDNLGSWHSGGYQDWLKEEQRRGDMRDRQELVMDLGCQKEGSELSQAAFQIAVTQISEMLAEFDPATIREALQKDPSNYTRLLNALPNLSEGELKCERHRLESSDRKAKLEKESAPAPLLGLTNEARRKIEEERFNPPPYGQPMPAELKRTNPD